MARISFPPGRLVWGHPSIKVQKRDNDRKPMFKDGQPVMVHAFGVAYDKATYNNVIWPQLYPFGAALYNGNMPPQHFSWKTTDGDGVDRDGKPYNAREGYAGCIIIKFETQLDVNAFRSNGSTWDQITKDEYKTGDYIAVSADVEGNKPTNASHTPGLYINPVGVLLVGVGTLISRGPTAESMFGGQQYQLPPGAQPPGAPPAMPPGMPNAPGFAPAAPQYQPQPQASAAPQYQPQPQASAAPQYQPQPQAPVAPQYQPQPQVPAAPQYQPQPQVPAAPQYQPQPQVPAAPQYQPHPGIIPGQQPPSAPAASQYQPQPQPGMTPGFPGQ